ncbi:dephospho-CoA kinase [Ichthyenterobacterium sp. W332]|uniref:Dephospho-CoA kinase n=1 Tax=Microcosmobacter mediterraneus TaxID=3075607 RepID=A0ABU2YHP4_9FLAO|nr:dephospho-CoA kinase [Ichthyenterobacterium sp. W332]MDT0557547.1 dephospho-CoA kinase [Ichthyenterobacterium sp. W332]
MKIVGLTGGIGSGKTTVAEMFLALEIPIYIADVEAKALMNRSKVIRRKLIQLFGRKAYSKQGLNKAFIASKIFEDKSLLEAMNAIVHPKVGQHFKRWLKKQNAPYVIKEVAIIYEIGAEKEYDVIILVTADKTERITRILSREGMTKSKALAIIKNQLPDEDKMQKADFVINNEDLVETNRQVLKIHRELLNA